MTTLHHTNIHFFESRMSEHSRVQQCTRNLAVADEYIYDIERKDALPTLRVWLSDAYHFGIADYLGRPSCIRRGDFILIARPEAIFNSIEKANKDGIGIGNIRHFMGALNYRMPSDYALRTQPR
jgi:hypothetical protein